MNKKSARLRRKKSIRKRVRGVTEKPRLTVFRSNKHIYAQIIDDTVGKTLAFASDADIKGNGIEKAQKVGELIATSATKNKIKKVVFDRNGYRYHGRIKALADGARNLGLEF